MLRRLIEGGKYFLLYFSFTVYIILGLVVLAFLLRCSVLYIFAIHCLIWVWFGFFFFCLLIGGLFDFLRRGQVRVVFFFFLHTELQGLYHYHDFSLSTHSAFGVIAAFLGITIIFLIGRVFFLFLH